MTVTVVEVIGVGLGTLVCGLPGLVYRATSPPPAITAMGLAVAAMGLTLLRPGTRWQTGGGVGFGFLVIVGVRIIVDTVEDPTSHNLWPFEIVSALVIGIPPAHRLLSALYSADGSGSGLRGRRVPAPR